VAIEVSLKDTKSAAFLEHRVSKAMLKTFVVQDKADYDLLYDEIRKKQKIPINITIVRNGQLKEIQRTYGESKMRTLKEQHGVVGYLDELFEAPDAVMQALRSNANVHRILVGDQETQKSIDDRGLLAFLAEPDASLGQQNQQTACIIAGNGHNYQCYNSEISRYSRKSYLRVDGIPTANILGPAGDPQMKIGLQNNLRDIHNQMKELRPKMEDAEKEKAAAEGEGQKVRKTRRRFKVSCWLVSTYKKLNFGRLVRT